MKTRSEQRSIVQRIVALLTLAGVAVLPLLGAEDDWRNLRTLRAGDRVEVIEKTGARISGKFVNNSASALMVDVAGAQQSLELSTPVEYSPVFAG